MPGSNALGQRVTLSLDRARVYRALAGLFRAPDADSLVGAQERDLPELAPALERLAAEPSLLEEANSLCELVEGSELDRLREAHHRAFDESSEGRCAPTEMDQLGGAPQLEMTRTFELADVAGFYRAFGVEIRAEGERPDHIAAELEFMHLLAVKEAVALQEEGQSDHAEVCRDASRSFLRDHLRRWAPRLGECLAESKGDPLYRSAGRLLGGFVAFDAERIDADAAPVHRIAVRDVERPDPP